jgi:tetratricopeptide (TPR) repeat protein
VKLETGHCQFSIIYNARFGNYDCVTKGKRKEKVALYKEVVSFANQANLNLANRNYEKALEAYTNALKIAKEMERSRLVAVLLNRMGHILQAQGKIQDAVITYESALRALDKDSRSYALTE